VENLKVLVVDDEPGIRFGAARVLRNFRIRIPELAVETGFAVTQGETGEEALAQVAALAPDILLLDHKLPGISGLDVLDRLAEQPRDMLTIMITAYATIETAVAATRRGAHDFLAKPFTPEELKSAVYKTAKHLVLQREARRLAAEKRQVRFQFLSVLAHELKAPLAAVEGYLQLLRDRTVAPDTPKYREVLDRSVVRIEGMRKLIEDLLDLTRIESGQKRRSLVHLDLCAVAAQAVDTARAAAARRGVSVALHAGSPVAMVADPGELEIILNNLLSNAVKYNRDGGRVDLAVTADGERVTLSVTDSGIGLSPEEVAQLGGEFVRIKNQSTVNIPGSGLGLSIVRKLAALYGGELSVASAPGTGSTFTVTLARGAAAAADHPVEPAPG
jgi:signal transduction histidine kinase